MANVILAGEIESSMARKGEQMLFDVSRWLGNDAVMLLKPHDRDFWHLVILRMWQAGGSGRLTHSYEDWATLTRRGLVETKNAIAQIEVRKVADVFQECNGDVTISNRYMAKKAQERERIRLAVRKIRHTEQDVTGSVNVLKQHLHGVTPSPPPSSPPPYTPTSSPTTSPGIPPSAGDGHGVAGGAAGSGEQKTAGKMSGRARKLSDEQNAAWSEFRDWWTFQAWPRHHQGEQYPFGDRERGFGADGPMSIEICRKAKFDIELIKRVAEAWLIEPEIYGNYDHKLSILNRKFNSTRRRITAGINPHEQQQRANGNHSVSGKFDTGFVGARRNLPDVVAEG